MNLRLAGIAALVALLTVGLPSGAQQQGPVIPQAPAGAPPADASQIPASTPHPTAAHETTQPGTPARPEALRDGAPLIGVPSWMERMAAGASESYPAPPVLPPDLPTRVSIPAGTRIPIVLETPLSSQFTQRGQSVLFRTAGAIHLSEGLEVPPGVEVRGRVAEVTRPGAFGRSGALRVTVERMLLSGAIATRLRAQLRSAEINSRGQLMSEGRRMIDREGLAVLSLQGALAGAQFGGKAAGIGAGAGAAIAAALMMSKKGRDVSVSRGTLFSVRLQQDAELSAPAVYWAQQDYASRRRAAQQAGYDDRQDSLDDDDRPVLKRRGSAPPSQP